MTGARSLTLKAPFLLTLNAVVMNTEKRFKGLENKRLYLSKLLTKQFCNLFSDVACGGYCHQDVALFCERWLKIYAEFRKVDKLLWSMSDDLPF